MIKKLLIGLPLTILFLFTYLIFPKTETPDIVKFLLLSQLIFLLYLLFVYLTKKIDFSFIKDRKLFFYFVIIGILIRTVVSFSTGEISYLSDDVYRYVWEGKLVANNYNPFILSPDAMSETTFADTTIYPKINHPWHVTIYPPVSQYLFVASYLLSGDSIAGFKFLSFIFELLSLFLMYIFVRKYKLPDWTFFLYLFSPLIIIEFLFSNHLDIFGLPFLLGALILLKDSKSKIFSLSVLLALGVLVKFYVLFFIPFIFFSFNTKEKVKFITTFGLTVVIFYLPFIMSSGLNVFGSLGAYLDLWQYNGTLYLLLGKFFSIDATRYICFGLFVSAYLLLLTMKRFKNNIMLQSLLIFIVYIIVTPVIFNWYLLWVIPFMIYYRNLALIALTGTCMLSYHGLVGIFDTGLWSQMPILIFLSYFPFFALLIYQAYKQIKIKKVNLS